MVGRPPSHRRSSASPGVRCKSGVAGVIRAPRASSLDVLDTFEYHGATSSLVLNPMPAQVDAPFDSLAEIRIHRKEISSTPQADVHRCKSQAPCSEESFASSFAVTTQPYPTHAAVLEDNIVSNRAPAFKVRQWQKYLSTHDGSAWWWCEADGGYFFECNPGPWKRFQDRVSMRFWWHNEATNEHFFDI